MMQLEYTQQARGDLLRISCVDAQRIVRKMRWFAAQEDPLSFAKPLRDLRIGSYRFRVGRYRILVDIRHGQITVIVILTVRHRSKACDL